MVENSPRLSKRHILPVAILIAMAFTYAGVDTPFFEVINHFDFIVNFIINFIVAYFLFRLTYHQHFTKRKKLWQVLVITLGTYFLWELSLFLIYDYDNEELTELYSITLPFVTLLLVMVNIIYYALNNRPKALVDTEENNEEYIWIDAINGRSKMKASNFKYAQLLPNALEIITNTESYKCFYSLKQFQELFLKPESLFRLNKNFLTGHDAIKSFLPLTDGRLKIVFFDGQECLVSKNKASSFKKWHDELKS